MKAAAPLFLVLILSVQCAVAQPATPPPADDHIDTVDVTASKVPLDKAINNFVKSYSQPTEVAGKIARWSAGMPLCPNATGLPSAFNIFVVERIRTVAGLVGAPIDTKTPCTPNLVVTFTQRPQDILDDIVKNNEDLLGYHDVSQKKQLATMSHPIEAWYETATRDDNGILHTDKTQDPRCAAAMAEWRSDSPTLQILGKGGLTSPHFQDVYRYCGGMHVTGNRATDGLHSEIGEVTVVVDSNKIVGMPLGAISDYIAMLAMSQTKAFETCQPLTSITNLMTAGCEAEKALVLTEADIAYLKGLYKVNSDFMGSMQTSEIAHQMEAALGSH